VQWSPLTSTSVVADIWAAASNCRGAFRHKKRHHDLHRAIVHVSQQDTIMRHPGWPSGQRLDTMQKSPAAYPLCSVISCMHASGSARPPGCDWA